MVVTYSRAKDLAQRLVGSEDRVETDGGDCIILTESVLYYQNSEYSDRLAVQ